MNAQNRQVEVLKQRCETLRSSIQSLTKTLTIAELNLSAEQLQQRAWELYCEDTRGDLDVRDDWDSLPAVVQRIYLKKVQSGR